MQGVYGWGNKYKKRVVQEVTNRTIPKLLLSCREVSSRESVGASEGNEGTHL